MLLNLRRGVSVVAMVCLLFLAPVVAVRGQPSMDLIDNGRGPVPLYLPSTYTGSERLPLIVALHGYTQSGPDIESYFDLSAQVDSNQFLYLVPEGTSDSLNEPFWNATDACCDLFGTGVDDSGYLRSLVDRVRNDYAVDNLSIHFVGYSNGGFMAHRMAIDHADLVASIVSLAGANYYDATAYAPSEPVDVLQAHGTADFIIRYNGGSILGSPYPGAEQTVLNWVAYNGLQPVAQNVGAPFDLDLSVPGDETTSQVYDLNNDSGISVELWTMNGSGHGPAFGNGSANLFAPRAVDWLLSHRKQAACDFNSDDLCDIDDLNALLAEGPVAPGVAVLSGVNDQFDLNGDAFIDNDDVDLWLQDAAMINGLATPYKRGDANLNGIVDGSDFGLWNANQFASTLRWNEGDFDGNAVTDGSDFGHWNANKFTSSLGSSLVPEPVVGSMALLAMGLWRRW